MAINGVEGDALDRIRVRSDDFLQANRNLKEAQANKADPRTADPGRLEEKFVNRAREASDLFPTSRDNDVAEIRSRPPEISRAQPQRDRDLNPEREQNRAPENGSGGLINIEDPTLQNEGLSDVNQGAARRQLEVSPNQNTFDQAASYNEVAAREDTFREQQERLRETRDRENLSQSEISRETAELRQRQASEEEIVQSTNLAEEGREVREEVVEREDQRTQKSNSPQAQPAADPVRNLDLLA